MLAGAGAAAGARAGAIAVDAVGTFLPTGGGGREIGKATADADVEACFAGTATRAGVGKGVGEGADILDEEATAAGVTAVDELVVVDAV